MNLEDLAKPFPRHKIHWRIGATNGDKSKGIALAYIDARDVYERLDEVCGAENWQCKYPHANGKTSCSIGIKINGEWVWKENGAGDSQIEAEKGAFSDAIKRAGVVWGIGRYLYDVENTMVELKQQGRSYVIKNPNDPKLLEALIKAEPRGLPESELKEFKSGLKECKTVEDLLNMKDKARAAWTRMSKSDQEIITDMINKTDKRLG